MASAAKNQEWVTLTGPIDKILFRSEDSGFSIFRIFVEDMGVQITVTGSAPVIRQGEIAECAGEWEDHPKYGRQLKAKTLKITPPTQTSGICKFLESPAFQGIGEKFAKKLTSVFGDKLIHIIENSPRDLEMISGFGPKRRKALVDAWKEYQSVYSQNFEIETFLMGHGIGHGRAQTIRNKYKDKTIEVIRTDPYVLCREISGIGFLTADKIALSLGLVPDSEQRIRAAIEDQLDKLSVQQGHCAYPGRALAEKVSKSISIDKEIVVENLKKLVATKKLVSEYRDKENVVFLPKIYRAEVSAAKELARIYKGKLPWGSLNVDPLIQRAEARTGFHMSNSQRKALAVCLNNKVSVITGGPGVGKSAILSALVDLYSQLNLRVKLAAPTGKAADRMNEATGYPASTIHRMLEFDGRTRRFTRNEHFPLDADVVILDEGSMGDLPVLNSMFKAVPSSAALIIIGDVDQLASVGVGAVLSDIIDSGVIPYVRLTEVFRQAKGSSIVLAAHILNAGDIPYEYLGRDDTDFRLYLVKDRDAIAGKLHSLLYSELPAQGYSQEQIHVLTSMHKGILGTAVLNSTIQERSNPRIQEGFEQYGKIYAPGDKIIQTRNCYSKMTFNGTVGRIENVDRDKKSLVASFDSRTVEYSSGDVGELDLAYASTVHRAQGSEFEVSILPLAPEHYVVADRSLVYTGQTRGKGVSIIISTERTLRSVLSKTNSRKRITYLDARIRELLGP